MRSSDKIAFVLGVGDNQGYGWAIAKSLSNNGVAIILGVYPPAKKIVETLIKKSAHLTDDKINILKIYPVDVRTPSQEESSLQQVAKEVQREFGKIDYLVHSVAFAKEICSNLLDTSKEGYLDSIATSTYSFVSMLSNFGPLLKKGGSAITLSYLAANRTVPNYGGGMSSAKAALESDTRTLAYEAGRKWGIRVNCISAGILKTRASKAIENLDNMILYYKQQAPLQKELKSQEVGDSVYFLLSSKASAITGSILYVDNGLHTIGIPSI